VPLRGSVTSFLGLFFGLNIKHFHIFAALINFFNKIFLRLNIKHLLVFVFSEWLAHYWSFSSSGGVKFAQSSSQWEARADT
jgi:hypothetical protein